MSARIQRDHRRVAVLWLAGGDIMQEVLESDWPPVTHGDDDKAAREWSRITGGITVTIRTELQTTWRT